jgi:hypothetical protein
MDSLIGLITAIATLAGLIVTILIFLVKQQRDQAVRRQEAYLQLELSSNEVFRFEALYGSHLAPFLAPQPDQQAPLPGTTLIDNHISQILNLFEIAARYRRIGFIDGEVFGSWVAWYHDLLCSWYFRHRWLHIREHYTHELRAVFDEPVARFDAAAPAPQRKRDFYRHVAGKFACQDTASWLDQRPGGRA